MTHLQPNPKPPRLAGTLIELGGALIAFGLIAEALVALLRQFLLLLDILGQ